MACRSGNQWESVRDELRPIRIFQQLGVRMMHLTYNCRIPSATARANRTMEASRTSVTPSSPR